MQGAKIKLTYPRVWIARPAGHIWYTQTSAAALWVMSLLAQMGKELRIGAEASGGGDSAIDLCQVATTNTP